MPDDSRSAVQRNRGARVRDISIDEAVEITEVRMLLEGHLAARAAERVAAVTARDPAEAEQAMRVHLQSVIDAFRALSDVVERRS
jgi:DNA-binding GntR family transcriptional regulator